MSSRTVSSFDEIRALLSKDLCWFLVYEAVVTTSEKLRIQGAPEDLEGDKARLYEFALQHYLSQAISTHLFQGRKVVLSQEAFEQAREYFALQVPEVTTLELSRYINYLEGWAAAHPDWSAEHPQSFETLEIIF